MRIGLIPLDERPVNTRYPAMIGAIAGVELIEPPLSILSVRRTPASRDQLAEWLGDHASKLDVLIVSIQTLCFGGLIASRTTDDLTGEVIARLEVLREIKHEYPALVIYGFDLITRISNADSDTEEPLYWKNFGVSLYRYSQLVDRQLQGQGVSGELGKLEANIPAEHRRDFLMRRLRNHTVNLGVIQMLAEGVLDLLVLSSDDTSEYGFGSREKRWLREWADRVVGDDDRLLMYPGADEVGCALLARALNRHHNRVPRFAIEYAIPGDDEIIAPFEDGPVRVTVERQVRAVGGETTPNLNSADFVVAVNTPSRGGVMIFDAAIAENERAYRQPFLESFVEKIRAWINEGKKVIVADVAYPNGADPILVDLMRERVDLTRLAAYGAWNTAGNTTGVALAQGVALLSATDTEAQARFLLHRFVEDWGYQHVTRTEIGLSLVAQIGNSTITPENAEHVKQAIETDLQQRIWELPGFAGNWNIVSGSVRLPWDRLFEVDFDLEKSAT
jgi:Protein of unknown function (DUF4127)